MLGRVEPPDALEVALWAAVLLVVAEGVLAVPVPEPLPDPLLGVLAVVLGVGRSPRTPAR